LLDTSETIKDLEIPEGRRLLHDFFHDRRLKHTFEFRTLLDCWKMCRRGTEIQFSDGRRVRFETHLGAKLGTRVFFEEVVSRYYFNFIQGLVYAGAVIILVTVGMYLAGYAFWFALAGFALEALFLLMLSVVTAYAPNEDPAIAPHGLALPENLLSSINSTVREMTNAVSDLFRLISQSDIRQDVLLTRLTEHLSKINGENIRLYAERTERMNETLVEYVRSVQALQADLTRGQSLLLEEVLRLTEAQRAGDIPRSSGAAGILDARGAVR
jgi:hypothetical protein